jgi:4-amino-4-deoxy-L-arabinose transferase-like glycosyltransferase
MSRVARILAPFERLLDALTDPARRERAAAWLLIGYCAAWSLYGALAKGSQDVHFDMGEMVAWSRDAGIGTPKHPPLAAWLVRVWFSVFPLTDASYYVLAMVLASFALWVAWRLSEPYLDGEKRVVGLVLLTFVPFFNFHALKYNANTVLVPLWALATWCFLRSFETRSAIWAAGAGLAAAAAMLGKYWSVFLLAGLAVAALADPRRGAYFRSAAPYVTIAVGALALAPHLAWIVTNDFAPFAYAVAAHPATQLSALKSGFDYLLGAAAYVAAPAALALAAARPGLPAVADTVWPSEPARRLVLIAFAAPIVLPALAAAVAKVEIVPIWAIGGATLLSVILLSSPRVAVPRAHAVQLLALGLAFPAVMTLAAPVIAIVIHRQGLSNYATHYRLLAAAVDRSWREATSKPMRFVGSYTNVVNGIVFYLRDRPSTLVINEPRVTPWADAASVARDGIALVCPEPEAACMEALNARARGLTRHAVTLSRRHFGVADPAVRYVIVVVPPGASN